MGLSRWQFDSTNAAVARTPRLSKCSNSKGEKGHMAFLDVKNLKEFRFSLFFGSFVLVITILIGED